jgi:hypothetical protein
MPGCTGSCSERCYAESEMTARCSIGREAREPTDGCQALKMPRVTGSETDQAPCPQPPWGRGRILRGERRACDRARDYGSAPASWITSWRVLEGEKARLPGTIAGPEKATTGHCAGGHAGAPIHILGGPGVSGDSPELWHLRFTGEF